MNSRRLTRVSAMVCICGALALVLLTGTTGLHAAEASEFRVLGGIVKFTADTNLSVLNVHGESSQMTATLRLLKDGNHVAVENVRARIDPKTFTTGMSLRDQHLRKKVFAREDDTMPELEFVSEKIECPDLAPGRPVMCSASGQLSLRGVARPFTINLSVLDDGKAYRISAAGTLKLSTYGIERPCQLGVCVTDDVKLNLEFQAKGSPVARAGGD